MGNGGPWLMLSLGGCALVVKADAILKTTIEGKWGIPHSFPVEVVAKYWPFSIESRNS